VLETFLRAPPFTLRDCDAVVGRRCR
jgi:hypothetical protein